jgi:hypothetical protein
MFTAAERHPFLFLKMNFHRGEIRPRVGPVAERLRFGSAASTPINRAGSNLQHIGTALGDNGLISHASSSLFFVPVVSSNQSTDSGEAVPVLQ